MAAISAQEAVSYLLQTGVITSDYFEVVKDPTTQREQMHHTLRIDAGLLITDGGAAIPYTGEPLYKANLGIRLGWDGHITPVSFTAMHGVRYRHRIITFEGTIRELSLQQFTSQELAGVTDPGELLEHLERYTADNHYTANLIMPDITHRSIHAQRTNWTISQPLPWGVDSIQITSPEQEQLANVNINTQNGVMTIKHGDFCFRLDYKKSIKGDPIENSADVLVLSNGEYLAWNMNTPLCRQIFANLVAVVEAALTTSPNAHAQALLEAHKTMLLSYSTTRQNEAIEESRRYDHETFMDDIAKDDEWLIEEFDNAIEAPITTTRFPVPVAIEE